VRLADGRVRFLNRAGLDSPAAKSQPSAQEGRSRRDGLEEQMCRAPLERHELGFLSRAYSGILKTSRHPQTAERPLDSGQFESTISCLEADCPSEDGQRGNPGEMRLPERLEAVVLVNHEQINLVTATRTTTWPGLGLFPARGAPG
jgi:hypothetical protein